MLGERNLELSKKMAADHTQRFIQKDWEFQEFGLPVFVDVTAVLFGKVRDIHSIEMNAIFVVDVVSGKIGEEDRALLYNQRGYFTPSHSPL